jgi:hypothetical protein
VSHHAALRGSGSGCDQRCRRSGLPRTRLEVDQRRAGGNRIAGFAMQRGNDAGLWRRDFHHGLGGFHGDHRLVDDDAIAHRDMPAHDFGFLQTFAQIRQIETSHVGQPLRVLRTASTMRSTLGI